MRQLDHDQDDATRLNWSDYERRAYEQIQAWKKPGQGWFGQRLSQIGWPVARLSTVLTNAADAAGLIDVITKALGGIMEVLGNVAAWTVRPGAVYEEFRNDEHDVHSPADLFDLDLEQVDKAVRWLDAKYTSLALGEGAAAGTLGAPGVIADIPALVSLNLRAIAEYATYYGFDVGSQRERLFVMHVLGLASSPSDSAKTAVMAQLAKIAADAAKKATWKTLEERAFVRIIQQIAQALGIRLTKAKLAQGVPIMGAVVGADSTPTSRGGSATQPTTSTESGSWPRSTGQKSST